MYAENPIPPTEDLMREHGVLIRILLIYKDAIERLKGIGNPSLVPATLPNATTIAQSFIENYHQRLEEDYVFPFFIYRGQHVGLVQVLLEQHNAARNLTIQILRLSTQINYEYERLRLARLLSLYIHMYEPHSAREDTVLYPAFRGLVDPKKFEQLGEQFEEIEEQKFGKNGFEHVVGSVAEIEQTLGIYDLSRYTPITF